MSMIVRRAQIVNIAPVWALQKEVDSLEGNIDSSLQKPMNNGITTDRSVGNANVVTIHHKG